MKLLNAVPVPDLDQASAKAASQAQQAVEAVIDGSAERRELHPLAVGPHSARRRRSGSAERGADRHSASGARGDRRAGADARPLGQHVRLCPDRRASQSHRPLCSPVWAGCWPTCSSFMPRRSVDITVERIDRGRLPELRRETLNPWFEAWYNTGGGPETPTYVPYHFALRPAQLRIPQADRPGRGRSEPDQAGDPRGGRHMIADKLHRPLTDDEQKPDATLDQLGLDSLDRMELNLHVEQRFGFSGGSGAGEPGPAVGTGPGAGREGTRRSRRRRVVPRRRRTTACWRSWARPSPTAFVDPRPGRSARRGRRRRPGRRA